MAEWWKIADPMIQQGIDYATIADKCGVSWQSINNRAYQLREKDKPKEPAKNLHDEVLKLAEKEIAITELCKKTGESERLIKAVIDDLKDNGYYFVDYNGLIKLSKTIIPQNNVYEEDWNGDKIIRMGITSDNHYCSKYQQATYNEKLYDIFQREGINKVYNCGDLTDGFKMRPGHEHEIFKHGADEQENYVVDNYPKRKGIVTEFILGNHDFSHIKNGGRDIGKGIESKRNDMKYLGMYNAKIKLTPNCVLELNHPLDGAAYALSYSLQKYIDSMSGGDKPNILINGHHHKMMYLFYRNIHAFEAGTTCAQTPWMKGKRIAAHVGGWIIEIHVNDEGTITRCKGEFFPFYNMIERDY